jgi:hypothetical protein
MFLCNVHINLQSVSDMQRLIIIENLYLKVNVKLHIQYLLLTVQCLESSYYLPHELWSHLCNKSKRTHASHQVNTADMW